MTTGAMTSGAMTSVAERIGGAGSTLTAAERRVAEVVLARPQLVAFGTVAELAGAAGAGAATVVRLSGKLGLDGFTGLQAVVQRELAHQLRPAAERIREPAADDLIGRHLDLDVANVRTTLGDLDPGVLAAVVDLVADLDRTIALMSGDASIGIARQAVGELASLRERAVLLDGNDVAVRRALALLGPGDVIVALDLRRYDRWVVDLAETAADAGLTIVSITDSVLSPLAERAALRLVVAAAGAGPFDSHVGTLALLNVIVAATADRLREHASERLGRIEAAWSAAGSLTDR
jgi:DNA-binding MurR/RpiR family transcriptional regulator